MRSDTPAARVTCKLGAAARLRKRNIPLLAAAVAVVVFAIVGVTWLLHTGAFQRATQEYFSDGLSEELLNALSRIDELQVAAQTSSFHFKGTAADLNTIAQKLNVATILEGSVRKRPQPLRRVYIPKRGSHKMRPLGIPAMIIRAQQALHLQGLAPVAETRADPHSYGFRRNRGTQDAIARVFNLLARKASAPWILEGDIKGCFDNFGHQWLERHVPMNKNVLSDWLKAECRDKFEQAQGALTGQCRRPITRWYPA